jgi:endogenous inhibitor of DNA gyrase (YacG/DUF329 family)
MPRILIKCPTTGREVPTGRRTQDVELADMVQPLSFRCPICQAVHSWSGADAWVEEGLTPAAARLAALPS